MKKTSKAILSIILCIVMLFTSITGVSAASAQANGSVTSAITSTFAQGLTFVFNKVVEGLLKFFVKIIPDSVNVENVNDYESDNFYAGTDNFIDEPADGAAWSLGYSSASIIPDDFSSGKYYKGGYSLNVNLTEVLDDLRVRVIAIDDGSGRGTEIFAVIDCIGLANSDVKLIREALSDFAAENNIISINVSATHIHSGIDTQGIYTDLFKSVAKNIFASAVKSDDLAPAIDTDFMNLIISQTAKCAKEAYNSMTEGSLTYAHKNIKDYVRDRTAPYVSIDDMYRLEFTPFDGSEPTMITSFGAHPENIGFKYDIATADFVYYMEKVVNDAGYNFVYFQGAVGTITENCNPADDGICNDRIESTQRYGEELGYILLGMTETEEYCIANIVDEEREAKADGSELYAPWYENWEPVAETEVEPILNIKISEFNAPVDNGVYAAIGKVSLADNKFLKDDNGNYYTPTEVGYMELGKDIKVILSPGETYAELIKGGSQNMDNFQYDCAYDIMDSENVIVLDLMNDAVGYIMPDNYFTYASFQPTADGSIEITASWGLTSLGEHAASNIYGEIYKIYDSVK